MKNHITNRKANSNIYLPLNGKIEEIKELTNDVRLLKIRTESAIDYKPGQFFMISVWGAGEVPISATSLYKGNTTIELCIRKTGIVTTAIHSLEVGQSIGIRGPFGNGFPLDIPRGKDVIIVAGGIGIAPLRPIIKYLINNKYELGRVTLLYGSRTPDEIIFKDETEQWKESGISVILTVDKGNDSYSGNVGFVTNLWHTVRADFKNAIAYICGPEVMIKAAMRDLFFFGMSDEKIITTLEAHMKCGVGKCGHCYTGPKYICTDGPVFSYKQIKEQSILM
ncbi:oxidoreductase [Dissulfurispira thermophila]|uniref:Oxidoreductase n=2 Tax=root TaxID=1 RepID=A0A7G1H6Q0_9BACT|nr:FAD/NAD(P)-binding protein [Dissulfurispira thermophila]BCB97437.1 oxidoreductase [Dissulfurispira thermophila]